MKKLTQRPIDRDLAGFLDTIEEAFNLYSEAVETGTPSQSLYGNALLGAVAQARALGTPAEGADESLSSRLDRSALEAQARTLSGTETAVPTFLMHALADGLVNWYGTLCMMCGAAAANSTTCEDCQSDVGGVALYVVSAPAGFGL